MVGEAFASKEKLFYYSLPCDVSIDPTSLFGKVSPTENVGEFQWVDGPVTAIVRNGGILNISEVNYMSPRVAASLYPLLDRRRYIPLLGNHGEIVHAHKDLLIIADMNPNYRGTVDINAAFMNRFPLKVRWGYDEKVEKKLVGISSLLEIARNLRAMYGREVSTPISTNMLTDFERFARSFLGLNFAIENFVSAFRADERQSVSNLLELNRDRISTEMNPDVVNEDDAEVIDDEFEYEDENLKLEDWEKELISDTQARRWNPVFQSRSKPISQTPKTGQQNPVGNWG